MSNIIIQGNEINARKYLEKITIEGIGEEKSLNPRIILAKNNMIKYSTEEQVIGTWIDGKPLYQKTFSLPGDHINDNVDLTTKGLTADIDSICAFTGIAKDHYGNYCDIQRVHNVTARLSGAFIQDDNKTLSFRSSNDDWVVDPIITLQYTKTTD